MVLHGTVVAVQTRGPELDGTRMWPQFSMGAAVTLVITQVGLDIIMFRNI